MSTIIRTRSPFFIRTPEETDVTLGYFSININLKNGVLNEISCPVSLGSFTLNKKPIGSENSVSFDISEIVNDFIEQKYTLDTLQGLNGVADGQSIWVQITTLARTSAGAPIGSVTNTTYLAQEGYNSFKQGVNYTTQQNALITSNYIQYKKGDFIYIPVNVEDVTSVLFRYNGSTISTQNITNSAESQNKIKYVGFNTIAQQIDEILINYGSELERTIKVEEVKECKYPTHKIVFLNRWGALQYLYFFKKSTNSLNTTSENYNASIFYANKISFGIPIGGTCSPSSQFNVYDTNAHTKKTYNANGVESITLNSGYVNELMNQSFEELMVSEYVWMTDINSVIYPVNLKESSFTKKTGLNDGLINYTMNFEKSFSLINNIR